MTRHGGLWPETLVVKCLKCEYVNYVLYEQRGPYVRVSVFVSRFLAFCSARNPCKHLKDKCGSLRKL